MKLSDADTFASCHHEFTGNKGSVIGTLLEFFLARRLNAHDFRKQQKKHEPDFVHRKRAHFNFEVKSTSSKTSVPGNRVAATDSHKEGTFLLAINYCAREIQPVRVRFGWVQPSDWVAQRGNGQQASLSKEACDRLIELKAGACR